PRSRAPAAPQAHLSAAARIHEDVRDLESVDPSWRHAFLPRLRSALFSFYATQFRALRFFSSTGLFRQSPPIQRAIFPSAPALEDHQQSRHWLQDRLEALPDQVPDHPQVPVQRQSEAIRLEVASRHLQSSAKILDPEPEREMCILQSDELKNLPLYMQ